MEEMGIVIADLRHRTWARLLACRYKISFISTQALPICNMTVLEMSFFILILYLYEFQLAF